MKIVYFEYRDLEFSLFRMNSMVMLTFSLLDLKWPILANLVQKIKIIDFFKPESPFFSKFSLKNQNWLSKLKLGI